VSGFQQESPFLKNMLMFGLLTTSSATLAFLYNQYQKEHKNVGLKLNLGIMNSNLAEAEEGFPFNLPKLEIPEIMEKRDKEMKAERL